MLLHIEFGLLPPHIGSTCVEKVGRWTCSSEPDEDGTMQEVSSAGSKRRVEGVSLGCAIAT